MCACSSPTAGSESGEENASESAAATKDLELIQPCSLFNSKDLATVFGIGDMSTIEEFSRNKATNTNQCQFIWTESASSTKSSQIMIDVMVNLEGQKSPTAYSRMLELDLINGLLGQQQQLIKPSPIADFGKSAYYWAQLEQEKVQKIKYQIDENYMIQIMYNSNFEVPHDEVKKKLVQIGQQLNKKINE